MHTIIRPSVTIGCWMEAATHPRSWLYIAGGTLELITLLAIMLRASFYMDLSSPAGAVTLVG